MTLFGDPENEDIVSRDTKFAGVFPQGRAVSCAPWSTAFGDSLGGLVNKLQPED